MADPVVPAQPTNPAITVIQDGGTFRTQINGDVAAQEAANALAANGGVPPVAAEPAKPPEGYDSWEAYGKAVHEGKAPEAKTAEAPKEGAPEWANDARTKAAYDEFTTKGDVTPETIAATAKALNVPEAMVKQYIDGVKATASQSSDFDPAPYHALTGDKAEWDKFVDWANAELPKDKLAAWGASLEGEQSASLALTKEHIAAWKEAGGSPPRDITNTNTAQPGAPTDTYGSMAEVKADMNDPRYSKDPAFNAAVVAKMARSPNI